MPPEAAPVATPPNAAQPVPDAKPGKKPNESFMQAMSRHGFVESDDDGGAEGDEGTDAPPAAQPGKAAPPPAANGADPNAAKMDQLKALATELGLTVDGQTVAVNDRVAFREAQRKAKVKLDADEKARQEAWSKREAEWNEKTKGDQEIVAWAKKLQESVKSAKDYDELAKALELGFENWDQMIEDSVSKFSDPNYKELKEQRQWRKDQEEKAAKAEREAKERTERETKAASDKKLAEDRAAATKRAVLGIQSSMRDSGDASLAALADDPTLVKAIFDLQLANFDRETRTTITVQQALDMPMPNGKTLRAAAREFYSGAIKRGVSAFGDDIVPEDIKTKLGLVKPAAPPAGRAPRTQTTPTNGNTTPSLPKPRDPNSPEERARFRKIMAAASDAEESALDQRRSRRG